MNIWSIGVNHRRHQKSVKIYAFNKEQLPDIQERLFLSEDIRSSSGITCNRTEIYCVADDWYAIATGAG